MYEPLTSGDLIVLEFNGECQACDENVGFVPEMDEYANMQVTVNEVYTRPVYSCRHNSLQFSIIEDHKEFAWSECWILKRKMLVTPNWEV